MSKVITLADIINKIDMLAKVVMLNKPTLDIQETAIYTGLKESYLYKLTSTQEIPHYKPRGKKIYFNREELDEWLQQNRVKSNSEIEQATDNHLAGVAK